MIKARDSHMDPIGVLDGQVRSYAAAVEGRDGNESFPISRTAGRTVPSSRVSWDDVQGFVRRLNAMEGRARYRLPTEAEWEYAARAGDFNGYTRLGNLQIHGEYAMLLCWMESRGMEETAESTMPERTDLLGLAGEAVPVEPVRPASCRGEGSQRFRPARHAGECMGVGARLVRGVPWRIVDRSNRPR